ncbi:MAG: twitch domain-containing radical SAM protein [Pseudobdellovibrio sp.]
MNSVSPSFCLAKWTSVTIHLESGTTHSCHHPAPHKIPLDEVKKNPSALHNTKYKLAQRQQMVAGQRPRECDYCWKIEDLQKDQVSDRYLKSAASWSAGEFGRVIGNSMSPVFTPTYVEVSFSNKCQFKCAYCSADYSSAWQEDLKKNGPYYNNIGQNYNSILDEDTNEYISAFWNWWPDIKNDLHTFRITGGEPLLSNNTFKILESLIQNPLPQLSLAINTNLGAPQVLVEKFINLLSDIEKNKCAKEIIIFTSIDAFGPRAEYIRDGLKQEYFLENVNKILQKTERIQVTLMCTFNALSITSFKNLFVEAVELNKKYKSDKRIKPVLIDISYLRHPELLSVKILPSHYIQYMQEIVEQITKQNVEQIGPNLKYYDLEQIKATRLLEWMKSEVSGNELRRNRSYFYAYFKQYDKRRNKNFLNTFPEMKLFWFTCLKSFYLESLINRIQKLKYILVQKPYHFFKVRIQIFLKLYYFLDYVFNVKMQRFFKPYYFLDYVFRIKLKKMWSDFRNKDKDNARP